MTFKFSLGQLFCKDSPASKNGNAYSTACPTERAVTDFFLPSPVLVLLTIQRREMQKATVKEFTVMLLMSMQFPEF